MSLEWSKLWDQILIGKFLSKPIFNERLVYIYWKSEYTYILHYLCCWFQIIIIRNILHKNSLQSHGAWLTFGNVDLHLIKGRPCVHSDDDLIVSHIAIAVSDMTELKRKLEKLNVKSRKNLSVPNPADSETGIVEQVRINNIYIPIWNIRHDQLLSISIYNR